MAKDRRALILQSTTHNGIDFVEIASADQKTLRVHFLNGVALTGAVTKVTITGGETVPTVAVAPIDDFADWSTDLDGNPLLTLQTAATGDFSTYTLTIESPALDPYYAQAAFSFKALCPSTLDCAEPGPSCPQLTDDLPPIDYLAKDFTSFKKALSDFSALRYPDWRERSEADLGVVMMEALCAIADDLSYTQDRYAAEAALDTATERRSYTRMSRLVDYEPAPANAASVLLQFQMSAAGPIPAGLLLSASAPDGSPIFFETGTGLADESGYPAEVRWNSLTPYFFDDADRCLRAGATGMWVEGHGWSFFGGQQLLVETQGLSTADPPVRQAVTLDLQTPFVEEFDPIFNQQVTRLFWRAEDSLVADHDLTKTVVKGNLAPATQGRRFTESFAIAEAPATTPALPLSVARAGPNGSTIYHYTMTRTSRPVLLSAPGNAGLAWVSGRPEVRLLERRPNNPPRAWTWMRWLLDADAFDNAFTVDPVRFSPVALNSDRTVQMDYDGDGAESIRFGDGVFGDVPEPASVFDVTYRVGGGRAGNLAPDSVWRIEGPSAAESASNPFAGSGGADAETSLSIGRNAPEAFRAVQVRAVTKSDYEGAAQRLAFVQRAGSAFRWTGSWVTVFTTADPKNSARITVDQRLELINLLNRYRMAGYESYVPAPRYASLDLRIRVCARNDEFRGDVQAAVLAALSDDRFVDGTTGFFHPDNFTFGQPLERSTLEAAIQRAKGVGGVISILYRRRGFTHGFVSLPQTVNVGVDEIILLENDPSRPERGSLAIAVEGGK